MSLLARAPKSRAMRCLYQPGLEDMLRAGRGSAQLCGNPTALREISGNRDNGQFISKAADTEQYYLDLKKDIDYDAQIEKRADASDDSLIALISAPSSR